MSAPSLDEYNKLKKEYDQLLQKYQNESIKIKQKEHSLNEQLNKLKNQAEQKEKQLNATIAHLQQRVDELSKANTQQNTLRVEVSPVKNLRIQELERDARNLIDQNIILTSQNTALQAENSTLETKCSQKTTEIQKIRDYISSLQKDLNRLSLNSKKSTSDSSMVTQEKLLQPQQFKGLQQKYEKAIKNNKELKEKLKLAEQETERMTERQRKTMNLVKKKEIQISTLQSQINNLKVGQKKRKSTQFSQNSCQKCNDFQQQIHLLKQMVKSTQGMVRVKQIQNEKFRMHSEEVISNQSRTSAKQKEKGTPLPPLKKK